ncbi:DUF2029 domain-containing protein [Rhodococcus sp. D2-41]|uniref:Glycosyltransferase 87 family protein n=1 Tax=Speluncibacter jeojiensis TaxID=2710754 RepID=A0A9X4RDR9_9ACTN|nr:glycosyltransferase 87 family protein [Rhodococcus sp. D2-41]MDG3009704.1 DUF2029 domain-containing protein [Rhodococcus sp. D2-41]MDG3014452.1 glycosyltransferase 87 family protein [Corynebacteriales bacterium D3-21]
MDGPDPDRPSVESREPDFVSPEPLVEDGHGAVGRDLPTRTDRLVAGASQLIGGPVGAHALIGRARFFTPMRVILLLSLVMLSLSWFGKAGCIQQYPGGSGGSEVLDWRGSRQYVAMCYSDTVPLYGAEQLSKGEFPYKSSWTGSDVDADGARVVHHMEYPVLTGLYQYASMVIAKAWYQGAHSGWLPGGLEVAIYFNVVAFGLAIAWLITVWASSSLSGRRVWDGALIALSPLVLVHAFTNFDALATAFAATGLLAWARRRPWLAGVLLGLGAAAKLYPAFLLGPLLVLCLRTGRMRQWWQACGAAVAAWVAVNAPIAILFPAGWSEFFRLNDLRGMDPDSIYNVIASFTGWQGFDGPLGPGQSPSILNAVSLGLFVLACVGVAYVGLTAPRRPRVAQLCFLVVAAFLLTNKVWSPQYSLWLVPLAVLALPHRRILLTWMTIDALVWVPRMYYYLGVQNKGLPEQWFTATVALRDIAVLVLCALILRQIYRPEEDLVRYGFVDDPCGGVLDRAADVDRPWRRIEREREPASPAPLRT